MILVPLSSLIDNPWQTRQVYDNEYIESLAADIAKNDLLQYPVGRLVNGQYDPIEIDSLTMQSKSEVMRLISAGAYVQSAFGHNRIRAFRALWHTGRLPEQYVSGGRPYMPVELRGLTDEQMAGLAWTENAQRKDLSPIEEALAIQSRMESFGWTQEQVAEHLGLGRSTVANKLRLLKLPDAVLEAISSGDLSARQGLALVPAFDLSEDDLGVIAWAEADGRIVQYAPDHLLRLLSEGKLQTWSSDNIRRTVDYLPEKIERFRTHRSENAQRAEVREAAEPEAADQEEAAETVPYQYSGRLFRVPVLETFVHGDQAYYAVKNIVHVDDDGEPIEGSRYSVVNEVGALIASTWATPEEVIQRAREVLAEREERLLGATDQEVAGKTVSYSQMVQPRTWLPAVPADQEVADEHFGGDGSSEAVATGHDYPVPVLDEVYAELEGMTRAELWDVHMDFCNHLWSRYAQDLLQSAIKADYLDHVQRQVRFWACLEATHMMTDEQADKLFAWLCDHVGPHWSLEAQLLNAARGKRLEGMHHSALSRLRRAIARQAGAFCYEQFLASLGEPAEVPEPVPVP